MIVLQVGERCNREFTTAYTSHLRKMSEGHLFISVEALIHSAAYVELATGLAINLLNVVISYLDISSLSRLNENMLRFRFRL